jgi:PPOX class probable F420-dependent enzyme
MSLVERGADLQYRFLDAVRSRRAADVASGEATASDFSALRDARQCVVATYKRSGEAVPTPVNFGLSSEGLVYFRSEPRSKKVVRIRHNPRVRVSPCNFRGKPTGAAAEGAARVLTGGEAERAEAIVADNWTTPMRIVERGLDRLPVELVYVEIRPAGGSA